MNYLPTSLALVSIRRLVFFATDIRGLLVFKEPFVIEIANIFAQLVADFISCGQLAILSFNMKLSQKGLSHSEAGKELIPYFLPALP